MSWPTVLPSDIVNRWRPLSASESTVAATRIGDAEAELRRQLRLRGLTEAPTWGTGVFDTVEEATDWQKLYVSTVVEMVRRFLMNTEGWTEEREEIDDYGRTRRRDASMGTGSVSVLDSEVVKLIPTNRRRRRGAFSVKLGHS